MHIRKALDVDSKELTRIAFAAKKHWDYPQEYYQVWENELTITPDYIEKNDVYLASDEGGKLGFYSVINWKEEIYLDHIFIDPRFLKQGIGSQLIRHLIENQEKKGVRQIKILVDPNAAGFYDKIGAKLVEYVPSNIEGRLIPLYLLEIDSYL